MLVNRELSKFQPVTIVLETAEELRDFCGLMQIAYRDAKHLSSEEKMAESLLELENDSSLN